MIHFKTKLDRPSSCPVQCPWVKLFPGLCSVATPCLFCILSLPNLSTLSFPFVIWSLGGLLGQLVNNTCFCILKKVIPKGTKTIQGKKQGEALELRTMLIWKEMHGRGDARFGRSCWGHIHMQESLSLSILMADFVILSAIGKQQKSHREVRLSFCSPMQLRSVGTTSCMMD